VVNLSLSLDGGMSYTALATGIPNTGSWAWTVPNVLTTQARVRIQTGDLMVTLAQDISPEDFTIIGSTEAVGDLNTSVPGANIAPVGSAKSPFTNTIETIDAVAVGDLIRGTHYPTVYFIDENGMRKPFTDSQTFFTYEPDFSTVKVVSDATLPIFTIGTPMLPRPGAVLVKIQSDPRVYWLEESNTDTVLHWIASEAIAIEMFGTTWADNVIDVPPTLIGHFVRGDDTLVPIAFDRSILLERVNLQ